MLRSCIVIIMSLVLILWFWGLHWLEVQDWNRISSADTWFLSRLSLFIIMNMNPFHRLLGFEIILHF
jgi:hypothetical protein